MSDLNKKINLFRRKREILEKNEEYKSLVEEFQPYLFKLYELQNNILKKRGWKLSEKIEESQDEMEEKDKEKFIELFWDSIVFK